MDFDGVLDSFDFDDLNFYFDLNANIDCCPGSVRPTRVMAESLSKGLVSRTNDDGVECKSVQFSTGDLKIAVTSCPGDARPIRFMAESSSKQILSKQTWRAVALGGRLGPLPWIRQEVQVCASQRSQRKIFRLQLLAFVISRTLHLRDRTFLRTWCLECQNLLQLQKRHRIHQFQNRRRIIY